MGRFRSKKQRILRVFNACPTLTNKEIARRTGASESYVDQVLTGKRRTAATADTPTLEGSPGRPAPRPVLFEPYEDTLVGPGDPRSTVSVPVSDDVAARLDAHSEDGDLRPAELAALLLEEGLKTREFPGIVYKDGPAGRRASLAGGPDVWQVIRALDEVPADGPDPVETVSIEADLHPRQISLARRFYETYPDEIQAMLDANRRALALADEMIAARERSIAEQQSDRARRAGGRGDSPGLSL